MKIHIMRSWRDLCEEAEAEADPRKFQKLAQQITRILRGKLAHLKACQLKDNEFIETEAISPHSIKRSVILSKSCRN